MGTPHGSGNVQPGAIDIDSPEFAQMFGNGAADEGSQEVPDFEVPADFAEPVDGDPRPQIIKDMQKPKRTPKAAQTAKEKAAAQKAKEKAAKAKEAERVKAKAEREKAAAAKKAEREAATAERKAAREAAKTAGPDLTGMVPAKVAQKATVQNIPLDLLDGIDGGDPVDRAFVENVKLHGILQPIRVRPTEDGRYNIIFGKRRSQAARAAEFATIPAVIEKSQDTNDYMQGLAENYARSNNAIEEHRMVMAAIGEWKERNGDAGADDRKAVAAIAKATGMTAAQIKVARNIGRLVPELMQAVEEGAMASHSAMRASRLPVEVQRRLVDKLNDTGKVTVDDVSVAHRHKQHEAVASTADAASASGQNMFDVPDFETGDTEAAADAEARVKRMSRTEKVAAIVNHCHAAIALAESLSAKSDDEKDAITFLSQIIENLTTPAA